MNYLVDIGHPGHVHLYKNLINQLHSNSKKVKITVKDMESAKNLLDSSGFNYVNIGSKKDSIFSKALNQLYYNYRLFKEIQSGKIPIGIGSSLTLAQLSAVTRMKSFIFDDDDDEVQPLFVKYGHPFCTHLFSPAALQGKRKKKDTIYYPGYHELAYLHPNKFTPDSNILKLLGLDKNERFFVLRFNVFKAHHDVGERGISLDDKIRLIEALKPFGRIFITVERDIEPELSQYILLIPQEHMHSLLYYASMFIGDSQTMTSEAAVLGTPAIRSNSFVGRISYLEELEHNYGLTYGFRPENFDQALEKIEYLLKEKELHDLWQEKRNKMLRDKIDVSRFMTWVIKEYPHSIDALKNPGPDLWEKFK